MSKLPTKLVITFLAIGLLVGAATTATIMSAGLKPFNLALAQLRVPFLPQQPRVQAPVQGQPLVQQPATTAASTSGGGSFGPNCVGCVTTNNLANGAVTTPKIAPGAVSISTAQDFGPQTTIPAGHTSQAEATCPSGSVVTGGGYTIVNGPPVEIVLDIMSGLNSWIVTAQNPNTSDTVLDAFATCATIHP